MSDEKEQLQNEIIKLKAQMLELIDVEKNVELQKNSINMQIMFKIGKLEGITETEKRHITDHP